MKKLSGSIILLLVLACLFTPFSFAESTTDFHSNIHSLLSMAMEDLYYYKIEGNDSGYVIRIAEEGLTVSVMLTALEMQPRDKWQSFIVSTIAWADSISNFLKECGVTNPNLLLLVVDDWEMEETLLAIHNGMVIFDYAPAK